MSFPNINEITIDNKRYPIREVFFEGQYYLLGATSLDKKLFADGIGYTSKRAKYIDEQILFFVSDAEIFKSTEYLQTLLATNIN